MRRNRMDIFSCTKLTHIAMSVSSIGSSVETPSTRLIFKAKPCFQPPSWTRLRLADLRLRQDTSEPNQIQFQMTSPVPTMRARVLTRGLRPFPLRLIWRCFMFSAINPFDYNPKTGSFLRPNAKCRTI